MIKTLTAATRELEDGKAAAGEILSMLDLGNNLLKNSLGIVSCFSEFEETGALKEICDSLPFECIGATTCLSAVDSEIDQVLFTLTVLTSDDCSFKTISIPITEKYEDSIALLLTSLLDESEEKPAFLLSYFPLINTIGGDVILTAIDQATGGIPLFGTMAIDHLIDYSTARTIHNGESYREALVMGAVYGASNFSFEIASLNESRIRTQKAIITESSGNILIGVNGRMAMEYLEEIGFIKEDLATGIGIIPLIIDHKHGTKPVARAAFALTPEGHVICGGTMPVNSTLSVGLVDMNDVLQTTENTLKPLIDTSSAVLSYSCMARYLSLGAHYTAEAEKVREIAAHATKYLFAYSNGEICPLPDENGNLKNYFHNYTIVFCSLS